jgi:hypothetical protein
LNDIPPLKELMGRHLAHLQQEWDEPEPDPRRVLILAYGIVGFLSGYKTNIGLLLVSAASVLDLVGVSVPPSVKELGLVLVGIGAGHKVLKDTGAVKG